MRISLLAGEMRTMHLSSSGALLSGAASIRLYQLVASVLTLLFTTSAIVSPVFLGTSDQSCKVTLLNPPPCSQVCDETQLFSRWPLIKGQ